MNELNISAVEATATETAIAPSAPKHKWLSKGCKFAKKATIKLSFDCLKSRFTIECEGKTGSFAMNTACDEIERISIATKSLRCIPYNAIYSNGKYGSKKNDLPYSDKKTDETLLDLYSFDYESL